MSETAAIVFLALYFFGGYPLLCICSYYEEDITRWVYEHTKHKRVGKKHNDGK